MQTEMPASMQTVVPASMQTVVQNAMPLVVSTTLRRIAIVFAATCYCLGTLHTSSSSVFAQDDSIVKCANLVYGNNKSSVCFSAQFMKDVNSRTNIVTDEKFTAVKLESEDLFEYPFAVMTGEGNFRLSKPQRESMKNYLTYGGFMVASAGCSSRDWAKSFKKELKNMFPEYKLKPLEMTHPLFKTFYEVKRLEQRSKLEGLEIDGKIVLVFSADGLNDSKSMDDDNCCCCGGNELDNARQINVNLIVYALTH